MRNRLKNKFLYYKNVLKEERNEGYKSFIKRRIKFIVILCIALLMITGYIIGSAKNSKNIVLKDFEVALKDNDAGKLRKEIRVDGKKVDKKKLEPLINYYKNNSNAVDNAVNILQNGGETDCFKVVEEKGIFSNNYYIELKTYNINITTNFQKGEFTIDDKDFVEGDNSIENVIPGLYTLKGHLKSIYGDTDYSKDIVLMGNEEVKADFPAVQLSVTSEYKDADIYINDENTNLKVEDCDKLDPIPSDGSVSIHIEREFPWGILSGDDVKVTDVPNVNLTIDMKNDEMLSDMKETAKNFYNSVFEALNSEDKSKIKYCTEETKDKVYSILEKEYFLLKNKYTLQEIKSMEDKNQYSYEDGEYKATFVVEVDYEIRKSILGFIKEDNSKKFFTKFLYKDDEWQVQDVENFSL